MILKKLNLIFSFFIVSILFIACSNKPVDVIEKYYEALMKIDRKGILECVYIKTDDKISKKASAKDEEKLDSLITFTGTALKIDSDKHGGFKNIEIISEEYNDDKSKVLVKFKVNFKDGTSLNNKEDEMTLINVDGEWKIDINANKKPF